MTQNSTIRAYNAKYKTKHKGSRNRGLKRAGRNPNITGCLRAVQKDRCYLCGAGLIFDMKGSPVGRASTREHVRPRSKGHNAIRNIALACERCNVRKGNREPYACELLYVEVLYEIIDDRWPLLLNGEASNGKRKVPYNPRTKEEDIRRYHEWIARNSAQSS